MSGLKYFRLYLVLSCTTVLFQIQLAHAQQNSAASIANQPGARDGQHDLEFALGNWKTHISRLQHPLTGSTTWLQMNGTKVVKKVWDGRAQIEEIEADGPMGHFEGLTLFLYNSQAHQWSMNLANSGDGTLSVPAFGEFKNGRGEFFDQEVFKGRNILVRQVFSNITQDSYRYEQSFSDDGGKTWEPNFVATLTRDKE